MKTKAILPIARRFNAKRHEIEVVIDWAGVTVSELRKAAERNLMVRLGAEVRRDYAHEPYPTIMQVSAKDILSKKGSVL